MKRLHALIEVDTFGTATIIGLIDCDVFNGNRLRSLIKDLLKVWFINHTDITDDTLNEYADELSRDLEVVDDRGNTLSIQWNIKVVTE